MLNFLTAKGREVNPASNPVVKHLFNKTSKLTHTQWEIPNAVIIRSDELAKEDRLVFDHKKTPFVFY